MCKKIIMELPKRKKLSGAQNRKRKRERELLEQLQARALLENRDLEELLQEARALQAGQKRRRGPRKQKRDKTMLKQKTPKQKRERETESFLEAFVNVDAQDIVNGASTCTDLNSPSAACNGLDSGDDPGLWPASVSNELVNILVGRGAVQVVNYEFPTNSDGRKFTDNYYYRNLPNGEKLIREWLVYSVSKDSVYCFCCKIFGKTVSSLSTMNGYSDWQHLTMALKRHETSMAHSENIKLWMQLNNDLKNKTTANEVEMRCLDSETKHWRDVLERIIAVIKFLARQCLSFRGSSSTLYEHDNGNFLKAIETIASFDSVMREHIHRIQSSESKSYLESQYLGDQIKYEIIDLLATSIKNHILDKVRESKYFSIILDCTPDESHTEQVTLVVRYVLLNNDTKIVAVRENFIGLCPVPGSTTEGLLQFVLDLLAESNLSIKNLRGHSYDYGSNMRDKYSGLQNTIMEFNNRAFYVPCSAHSLNSVVNDAANVTHEAVSFFNTVQDIYVFFSLSTQRWSIISKHLPDFELKASRSTRWSSKIDAIKPLRYHLHKIFDALLEISDNNSSKWDCTTTHKAHSLALSVQNYKFICSVVIWFDILNEINNVSKMMQYSSMSAKMNLLNNLIQQFMEYRTDEYFEKLLEEAENVAQELNAEAHFPPVNTIRRRIKPTKFKYELDEYSNLNNPKNKYKEEFFFQILDQTLVSLKDRFEGLKTFTDVFGFLSNDLYTCTKDEILEHCKALHLNLKDHSSSETDIDGTELYNEISVLKLHFPEARFGDPYQLLQYIFSNDLISTFPNIAVALRILLTLPVLVPAGETSFSRLKNIRNYLRSKLHEEQISNLDIVSIEHAILETLDTTKIAADFANIMSRRVQYL